MIELIPMTNDHLDEVWEIEAKSFTTPWSKDSLYKEINENKLAYYFVAKESGQIIGYFGMWHIINEGHITNVAVSPEWRGLGVGSLIMDKAIAVAKALEMNEITLEVRTSNRVAQKLYMKKGFRMVGIRKNYYQDSKEDAILMTKALSN